MVNEKKYIRDGRAPIPSNEKISQKMSSIKCKNTKPELILRKELYRNGIRGYRLHWKKIPGKPDITFVGKKIAIFINGCFWHRCPICNPPTPKSNTEFWLNKFNCNIKRDKLKIEQLHNMGWKAIIIWECQIKSSIDSCIEKIKEIL